MKISARILLALSLCFSGCSRLYDTDNPVGGGFARANEPVRSFLQDTRTFGLDTLSAKSVFTQLTQNLGGPTLLGNYKGYDCLVYAEFKSSKMPGDFRLPFNGRLDAHSSIGIKTITLRIALKNNSAESHDTLKPVIAFCRGTAGSKTVDQKPLWWIEPSSIAALDSADLPDTVFAAPKDSGFVTVTLTDTVSPLFQYLDSAFQDTSRVFSLVLKALNGTDTLFSLDPARPPQILYSGLRRDSVVGTNGGKPVVYFDSVLVRDSVSLIASVCKYSALPQSIAEFTGNPALSSLYIQKPASDPDTAGARAGYYTAEFSVPRDSFFRGLNSDSLSAISAVAEFFVDTARTFSRNQLAVHLYAQCLFLDTNGNTVAFSAPVGNYADTLYKNFAPGFDTALSFPVTKFFIALTDPSYSRVRTVKFILSAVFPSDVTTSNLNFDHPCRIVFKKSMRFSYKFERLLQ